MWTPALGLADSASDRFGATRQTYGQWAMTPSNVITRLHTAPHYAFPYFSKLVAHGHIIYIVTKGKPPNCLLEGLTYLS
ncbi:hypothetical protein ASPFODRAFT_44618 [Aspergillus luchuensis CBS 106.47]|uniref:Uncharacterized protein n=1 Tax=Aspergillus luchuensis (strain CBS 106.47) TaxID=1137211 RepID=A0A1M3TPT1_ASPLC|nr:hypothetical protein ASPFODRAFT_44618 [Aspergillus luchuensis CBS 106.47]